MAWTILANQAAQRIVQATSLISPAIFFANTIVCAELDLAVVMGRWAQRFQVVDAALCNYSTTHPREPPPTLRRTDWIRSTSHDQFLSSTKLHNNRDDWVLWSNLLRGPQPWHQGNTKARPRNRTLCPALWRAHTNQKDPGVSPWGAVG